MIDYSRRRLLGYGGAMVVAASFGGKLVGHFASAAPAPLPVVVAPSAAFMNLSITLTGYDSPDVGLATRLYAELRGQDETLEAKLGQIAALIAKSPSGPLVIDSDPALSALYHQIVSGWYLGIVGPASAPRCIGFENIVSYRVVQATLSPPSYCAGQPNFWAYKPA